MVSHAVRPAGGSGAPEGGGSITEGPARTGPAGFLPDLCTPAAALTLVVGVELLALVLALAPGRAAGEFWPALGRISLHAQWTALPGAALLCLLRRPLARLTDAAAAAAALALFLAAALAVSLVGAVLLSPTGRADPVASARALAITGIVAAAALRYLYVQHQARVRFEAAARARLALLQARMRPHFLFNSLNTIASLASSDPARAESVTEALAELLRASLHAGDAPAPLAQEIALCRRYLEIEQLRLGPRLKVEWTLADIESALLPPLTLQPLVENAVHHGIEPLPQGGVVCIRAWGVTDALVLEVENPAPQGAVREGGNRMAQDNLRARLAALYGQQARLEVTDGNGRYCARLRVPLG